MHTHRHKCGRHMYTCKCTSIHVCVETRGHPCHFPGTVHLTETGSFNDLNLPNRSVSGVHPAPYSRAGLTSSSTTS